MLLVGAWQAKISQRAERQIASILLIFSAKSVGTARNERRRLCFCGSSCGPGSFAPLGTGYPPWRRELIRLKWIVLKDLLDSLQYFGSQFYGCF